jgi:hypothetical protein
VPGAVIALTDWIPGAQIQLVYCSCNQGATFKDRMRFIAVRVQHHAWHE